MKSSKNLYSSSQRNLYIICLMGWNLCKQYLPNFKLLKAFYSDTLIDEAIATVESAKSLTTSRVTIGARKEARINLVNATKLVRTNWQLLKVYITKAFPKDLVKTKLEVAGASLYNKASLDNWTAVLNLIDAANTFIEGNITALTDNQNMPPQFKNTFTTDGADCINLSKTFFDLDLAKELAANKKLEANNAIYSSLIEMLKDGQQIFKADEAMKKQFTFSYLLSVTKGEGSASLKGYITNVNNQPIEGVTIISMDEKYKTTTDKKGRYHISKIAAGDYTFTITKPGYDSIEQVITFKAGTASKVNFELIHMMQKVA